MSVGSKPKPKLPNWFARRFLGNEWNPDQHEVFYTALNCQDRQGAKDTCVSVTAWDKWLQDDEAVNRFRTPHETRRYIPGVCIFPAAELASLGIDAWPEEDIDDAEFGVAHWNMACPTKEQAARLAQVARVVIDPITKV